MCPFCPFNISPMHQEISDFSWCRFIEWRKKTTDLSEKWNARQGHIIYEVVNTRFLELTATSPYVSANLNQQNDIKVTSTVFFITVWHILANPPARRAGQLLYGSPVVQTLRWYIIPLPQTRTVCRSFLWWWTQVESLINLIWVTQLRAVKLLSFDWKEDVWRGDLRGGYILCQVPPTILFINSDLIDTDLTCKSNAPDIHP